MNYAKLLKTKRPRSDIYTLKNNINVRPVTSKHDRYLSFYDSDASRYLPTQVEEPLSQVAFGFEWFVSVLKKVTGIRKLLLQMRDARND